MSIQIELGQKFRRESSNLILNSQVLHNLKSHLIYLNTLSSKIFLFQGKWKAVYCMQRSTCIKENIYSAACFNSLRASGSTIEHFVSFITGIKSKILYILYSLERLI